MHAFLYTLCCLLTDLVDWSGVASQLLSKTKKMGKEILN